MTMTILKFSLEAPGAQTIEMPGWAAILCVQTQDGIPYLWALANHDDEPRPRKIVKRETDELFDYPGTYIGTYQVGDRVFHVFEDMGMP